MLLGEDVVPAVVDAAKLALNCSDRGDFLLALEAFVLFRLASSKLSHYFLDVLLHELLLCLLLSLLLLLLVYLHLHHLFSYFLHLLLLLLLLGR